LIANVTHQSDAGTARDNTVWRTHVHTTPQEGQQEKWFQIQDLIVEDITKDMVMLGDLYIQVRSVLSLRRLC
jgi:U4/U6.U5 tri-snRNP-associated protein 2